MTKTADHRVGAVIVAAGRGTRMGGEVIPKQYLSLGGKAVLRHTIDAFLAVDDIVQIVPVIREEDWERYKEIAPDTGKLAAPISGGATRQLSVLAGLKALEGQGVTHVLVHDAARPLVTSHLIETVIAGCLDGAAALPGIAIADTIKRGDSERLVVETVSRDDLYAAQTPQGFAFGPLIAAHRRAAAEGLHNFTDDSALTEWAGMPVRLVPGDPSNTKITTREDFEKANTTMKATVPDVRTGHGYDSHQWADGSSVWLCGIEIPHTHRLSGHSDADVGLHALTDAVLGAIAAGDIGSHFPPSDQQWKDASSDRFLTHAAALVDNAGGQINHVDITLICEAPKIGPHRVAMRQRIATLLSVDMARVSVKATTNERIGFIGRGEGMAAMATATVVMRHG